MRLQTANTLRRRRNDFRQLFLRPSLAGLGVAIAAASLGCIITWRWMAYLCDATAHATILGVALALSFSTSVFVGVLAVSLAMATIVTMLSRCGYTMDTLLREMVNSALAFGLLAISLLAGVRIDLMAYLFGDILAVDKKDLAIIRAGAGGMALVSAFDRDTKPRVGLYASGTDPKREQMVLTVALAIVVAVAIKVVGVLLVLALLIISAATAHAFANTPERMALIARLTGTISALGGLQLACQFDTPTGPTIVALAAVLFALANIAKPLRP